jgi:predicted DNA-binding transcriptional regulator AlpA
VGVPETPNTQGSPRLLTVPEITERYGISRQAIHAYRQRGVFPQPAPEQGSTRLRFREDEVDAFFVANPKRPGRRTDRPPTDEGDRPMDEEPLHLAEDDTPMRSGYSYAASGIGVRDDLVAAVLEAWANVSPTGDPALTLRSVNDGAINRIDNLARMAAAAVLQKLTGEESSA